MTIRMGYWDCPSCNHKKNLGPNATCEGCGLPRGPKIPFYTDDSAPVIEDPELVAQARRGADWKCKYCSSDNRAGFLDCHQCGAGPDGTVRREERFIPNAPAAAAPPAKKTNVGLVIGIVLAVLTLVGAGVWFTFLRTTELSASVTSAAWVKTAQLEERVTERSESWHDQVPSDGRVVEKTMRGRDKKVQDGTERVKVGQKDLGNGMFEDVYQDKPKYVTRKVDEAWVTYEREVWRGRERLERRTTDGSEPPDPAAGQQLGPKMRVGARTSRIVLELRGEDGKSYSYEEDASSGGASRPAKYEVGKSYKAQVNAMGSVRSLGSAQ